MISAAVALRSARGGQPHSRTRSLKGSMLGGQHYASICQQMLAYLAYAGGCKYMLAYKSLTCIWEPMLAYADMLAYVNIDVA